MSRTINILLDGIDVSLPPVAFPGGHVPAPAVLAARQYLGMFVVRQANRTRERVGFSWVGSADAPDSYDALVAAWNRSAESGEALPISKLHCANSIFLTAKINVAQRFWHDAHHVLRQRDFSPAHEIDMALWQLDVAAEDGVPRGSVAWCLLEADTLGQSLCSSVLGRFPVNQLVFDINCMRFGIADALVMESEQDLQRQSDQEGPGDGAGAGRVN